MKRRKIALVGQPFDRIPSSGSIAIWCSEVATHLSREHDLSIYAVGGADQLEMEMLGGVELHRLSARKDAWMARGFRAAERGARRLVGRGWDLFYRHLYFTSRYYKRYARKVARRAREQGVDTLIVTNFAQFLPILRRELPEVRLVLMMQCDWLVELDRERTASWIKNADLILGCSDYIANGIAERFPELAPRVHPLYNGSSLESLERECDATDLHGLALEDSDELILFVGRITPEKGVHALIDAMPGILEAHPRARLVISGPFAMNPPSPAVWVGEKPWARDFESLKDDYEAQIRRRATDFGDRVQVLGGIPHTHLATLYRRAQVFVHPALWNEPFGMILTEAMACGCPVVSTTAGGIPEIVMDQETGLLVEPGDQAALARAICELLSDPARAEKMGSLGRERLQATFTWAHNAARLNRLLRSLPD